jgi:hypothetical protein
MALRLLVDLCNLVDCVVRCAYDCERCAECCAEWFCPPSPLQRHQETIQRLEAELTEARRREAKLVAKQER